MRGSATKSEPSIKPGLSSNGISGSDAVEEDVDTGDDDGDDEEEEEVEGVEELLLIGIQRVQEINSEA